MSGPERSRSSTAATGPRLRISLLLLVFSLLPLAAVIVFLVRGPAAASTESDASLTGQASRAAEAAARSAVHTVISYDYRRISSDVKAAEADATGVFARQYAATATQLLSQAPNEKAIVQATVGSSGVVSAGPNNVVVLLFVDQATVRQLTGAKTPATRIDQNRVQVTMTRVGSKWLISQLSAL